MSEKSFSDIPRAHPLVNRIINISLRRWKKSPYEAWMKDEYRLFYEQLKNRHYDAIIDAQGLLKSAVVSRLAKGPHFGLDWESAKEPLASLFYEQKINIPKRQHAIQRIRELFSKALNYPIYDKPLNYGINPAVFDSPFIT